MSRRTAIQSAAGAGAALAIGGMLAGHPTKAAIRPSVPRTRQEARDGDYFLDLWRQREERLAEAAEASDACDEAEYAAKKEFPISPGDKLESPLIMHPHGMKNGKCVDLNRKWEEQLAPIRKELADWRRTCQAILREHGVMRLEAKARVLWDSLDPLEKKIAETPAADVVGVRVKFKIVEMHEVVVLACEIIGSSKLALRAFETALVALDCIASPTTFVGMKNGIGPQLR